MDKRWKQLGNLLVNYSTEVKRGEKVLISMLETDSYPLVVGVYEACIKAEALPQVVFQSERLNRFLLKYGNNEQIDTLPELERHGMEWADVYIGLRAASNPHELWDTDSEKLARLRSTMGKISTLRWQKTRWCLVRIPTAALAQQAELDEETLLDMFFDACLVDWENLRKKWERWVEVLNKGHQVRILGRETDLSFSIKGRTWSIDDGHINMPGGEISTAPLEDTVDGCIYFETPVVFAGKFIYDLRLCWQKGELVRATASSNQDFLHAVLKADKGASKIGEFAIGTNPNLKYFCYDLLLDEKIYGTIHIALGRAYPKVGGTNQSAIHWDMVKDLRSEGEIYLDGELIFKNGQLLL
ncbi:MAG: Peptidase M29 aminopeptidase II [Thermotoga sp. 50_1627]|nr:MAG: Peptidase M29 aminopeptidase II [Thermotoga sp. 50_64]KUK24184.1 MAG: Peptidase M29 aminopeptidase II [Thermotoga sp. 50_1627]HBT39328.1 aminopeptidase [Pseudothermotoga sp.]HCO97544.1 aminopeptidase [Pseudothermotoga sp.]